MNLGMKEEAEDAIRLLWRKMTTHYTTGGSVRIAKFFLGIFDGANHKFDLTDFRLFDKDVLVAAMMVLASEHGANWEEIQFRCEALGLCKAADFYKIVSEHR